MNEKVKEFLVDTNPMTIISIIFCIPFIIGVVFGNIIYNIINVIQKEDIKLKIRRR